MANASGHYKALEGSVMNKIFDGPSSSKQPRRNEVRTEVCMQLFEQMEEESDDESSGSPDIHEVSVEVMKGTMETAKQQKTWGPVVVTRVSARIKNTRKTVMERAQELKKVKELEIPKGNFHGFLNSFAALDNASLIIKARDAGVSLGISDDDIEKNISTVNDVEQERLKIFHSNNHDMFPSSLGKLAY